MRFSVTRRVILIVLPFIDVLTEIGVASAFPQLRAAYASAFRASLVVAVSPLFAVLTGWMWGAVARRKSIGYVVSVAMMGWVLVTIGLGLAMGTFGAALILRALQGTFSAGFAALPFIEFARHAGGDWARTKSFGMIETAVSAGAILAPVLVGMLLGTAPRAVLASLAGVTFLCVLFWVRAEPGRGVPAGKHGEAETDTHARAARGRPAPATVVARRVLVPTAFAAGIALVLGAFETLIPTVVEDAFGSVFWGKATTMIFEIAVVAGILLQARRSAVGSRVPHALALVVGMAYVAAAGTTEVIGPPARTVAALALMVLAGGPIGAAVTVGNEYAASRVEGAEDVGMGLYSTLRVTGSFLGPLFMNISYPTVLAALAAVSVICAALVPLGSTGARGGEGVYGNDR